jgi:Right handed beta helix region
MIVRRKFLSWIGFGAATSVLLGKHKTSLAQSKSASTTFYVALNGNDAWSGKSAAPNAAKTDGPLATLEGAKQAIRALAAQQGGALKQPVTVYIRGGRHQLKAPLILTPSDSGSKLAVVTYAAYTNEKPVISGGRKLTNWKTATVNGRPVWVTSLTNAGIKNWSFINLWVNGVRRYRARYPDKGYLKIAENAPGWDGKNWLQPTNQFYLDTSKLAGWKDFKGAEIIVATKWEDQHLRVEKFDSKTGLLVTRVPSRLRINKGYPYYLENSLSFLTSPGEWFLDKEKSLLYYYPLPGEKINKTEVIAPVLNQLIQIRGTKVDSSPQRIKYTPVQYLKFEGLTFSHTDWQLPGNFATYAQAGVQSLAWRPGGQSFPGAVYAEGANYLTWKNCTFNHLGTWALDLRTGCKFNTVQASSMYDLASGGVRVGFDGMAGDEVYSRDFETHTTSITNCRIYEYGRIYHCAVGIWIGHSYNNLVSKNHIHSTYYSGISVGWWGKTKAKANRIESNYVHDIAVGSGHGPFLNDIGAIYTIGIQPGTVILNNVIHDVAALPEAGIDRGFGIYLDENSCQIRVENNLVYRTVSGGFHQNYGRDNLITNNIFALGKIAQIRRSRKDCNFIFTKNIVYWTEGKLLNGTWQEIDFSMDKNIYWNPGNQAIMFDKFSWNDWRARGLDKNSIIADPKFAAPKSGNFGLAAGSPASKIGFKPFSIKPAFV